MLHGVLNVCSRPRDPCITVAKLVKQVRGDINGFVEKRLVANWLARGSVAQFQQFIVDFFSSHSARSPSASQISPPAPLQASQVRT
jgi:hypothetical protein